MKSKTLFCLMECASFVSFGSKSRTFLEYIFFAHVSVYLFFSSVWRIAQLQKKLSCWAGSWSVGGCTVDAAAAAANWPLFSQAAITRPSILCSSCCFKDTDTDTLSAAAGVAGGLFATDASQNDLLFDLVVAFSRQLPVAVAVAVSQHPRRVSNDLCAWANDN